VRMVVCHSPVELGRRLMLMAAISASETIIPLGDIGRGRVRQRNAVRASVCCGG